MFSTTIDGWEHSSYSDSTSGGACGWLGCTQAAVLAVGVGQVPDQVVRSPSSWAGTRGSTGPKKKFFCIQNCYAIFVKVVFIFWRDVNVIWFFQILRNQKFSKFNL